MTTNETAGAQAPPQDERLAYRGPIQRLLTRPEIGALIGAAGIWLFFWAVSDVFGTAAGVNNYLDVSATLGIMSVAVALLMIGGEFDLSSGAMTGATGMLVILLVKDTGEFGGFGWPLWLSIPATLAFALGIGYVNGTLVERTALPSFIVTLGTFFALRGAKLGFAKLFTDKVIVEGLNDAPDFGFWDNIFGAVWIRNDHLWDSFLWGRDVVFAALVMLGVAAVVFGLAELSFRRRASFDSTGLGILAVGAAGSVLGLTGLVNFVDNIGLTQTDGTTENWIYGVITAAGAIVALYGLARWRYEPKSGDRGSFSLAGDVGRSVAIGVAAIVGGVLFGLVMDSEAGDPAEDLVLTKWLLLTWQGLRAILFAGLVIVGVVVLMIAARRARQSPTTQFGITSIAAALIAVLAFIVQSEGDSQKFRAVLFAWIIAGAVAMFASALLQLLFTQRRAPDDAADRLGRRMSMAGIGLVFLGLIVRLLWTTTAELETVKGQITFRISVLYFILFAVVASYVLLRTRFGSWTFAVGGNKNASRQVGVPAARTKTQLFMLVSAAAWLVGMLTAFRLNSVQANVGDGQEFFYIIAAVVGGNLLTGGYGSVAGASIGALIMAMSFQGIPFAGWNSDWRFLFVGVILLLAVLANNYVRRKAEEAS